MHKGQQIYKIAIILIATCILMIPRHLSKNEKAQKILKQTIRIYTHDIRMEFVIEKYAKLVMKDVKGQIMEGIKKALEKAWREIRL